MPYADGTFTAFKQSGPTRVSYPFVNYPTKDKTCKKYDVTGWILPGSYTPANALSTYPGDGTISADNVAYLVNESDPQLVGGAYSVDRSYCNIPNTQTLWGNRMIDRPSLHDVTASNTYGVSFDDGETSHLFTSRVSVSSVGAIAQITNTTAVPAESFADLPTATFTVKRTSGGIYVNYLSSPGSSIYSGLPGIAGLEVFASKGSLVINWTAGEVQYVETSANGVTMSSSSTGVIFSTGNAARTDTESQTVSRPTRVITTGSAHSGSAGGWLALWNGSKIVATTKAVAASGSSITVFADEGPLSVASVAITHAAFASQAAQRVVNGPTNVSTRITETFYLPTVTPGISTPADITLSDPELDPVSWLTAIAASAAYAVIDGSQLEQWQGPIYRVTKTEAQMSDAVKTVAVGA